MNKCCTTEEFKNILAVCRSRNISCDIILQNIAQLKSLFKDDWEGIIGNCDTLLYLGGNEYGTYEYLSKILGKETERTKSQSIGKGSRGSSSDSCKRRVVNCVCQMKFAVCVTMSACC